MVLHLPEDNVIKQHVKLCCLPGVSFIHVGDGWIQNCLVPVHLHHTFCV